MQASGMWKLKQENIQGLPHNKVDLNKLIFRLKAKRENSEKVRKTAPSVWSKICNNLH